MTIGAGRVAGAEIWGSGSAVLAGLYIWGDSALPGSLLGLVNTCELDKQGGARTVALDGAAEDRACRMAFHSPASRIAVRRVHGFFGVAYLGQLDPP